MSNVEQLPARQDLRAGGQVQAIVPQSMEEAYRIAKAVCAAGLAPEGLNTPEKALVAIMHGAEIGVPPMTSLQRIAVINGRPAIWGDLAIGLVRASGTCEYVKEWIEGEGDKMVAHCEAKRKAEREPTRGEFSVADAKAAGLWDRKGRNGEPGMYKKYPKRMLQMRARGFALRDGFADVLGGLYLREELEEEPREMRDVTPVPPAPPAPVVVPPPPESPVKQALRESLKREEPFPELPKELDRRPKRQKGEPRRDPTPYHKAQAPLPPHDAETGEIIEGEALDPDKYLDELEERAGACPDLTCLAELQEEHKAIEDKLFPPDRDKADKIFESHAERISAAGN